MWSWWVQEGGPATIHNLIRRFTTYLGSCGDIGSSLALRPKLFFIRRTGHWKAAR